MAFDIGKYNGDFRAFVDFASAAKKGSAIAQLGGDKNAVAGTGALAGRSIVAKTTRDSIGNVGRLSASRDVNNAVRDHFMQTIIDMFGGASKVPKNVQDAMKLQDYGKGKPLTARRIMAVAAAVQKDIALTKAANKIGFSGKATAEIARFCLRDKSLVENADPAAEFKRRMNENCKDLMMKASLDIVCKVVGQTEVRRDVETPSQDFYLDFARGTEVTIGGVKYRARENATEDEIKQDFKKVCDAFVQFITGDKKATFETASKAVKLQANVLMGYANQATDAVVMTGAGIALDPERTASRFSAAGTGERNQSYVFSKNEKGDIRFGFELGSKGAILNMSNADGKYATKFDRGASIKYGFSGTITMAKFDRFANANWAGLSDEKVLEIKKLDRDMKTGWIDDIANGIPEPYRLEMENIDTTFSIESDNPVNIG